MEKKKEIMETLAKILNKSFLTVKELSEEMRYTDSSYLTKKVNKLKLGYKIKNIHLLSKNHQKILKNSIYQREDREKKSYRINSNKGEIDETIQQIEELLIKDLNKNYCSIADLAKQEGYEDSTYFSRKAKRLGLGIRIKTITLLSKEDQETLINSIKRRKREDS